MKKPWYLPIASRQALQMTVAVFCLLMLCAPGYALLMMQKVTPEWTREHGITVETSKREDKTIGFVVKRYLDKTPQQEADSPWTTARSAHLEIGDGKRIIASTSISGDVRKDADGKEMVVYTFTLSPDFLKTTRFSLYESEVSKDPKVRRSLFGTVYNFDLEAFAAPRATRPLPLYPGPF